MTDGALIIGGGTMGCGIAAVFAGGGWPVTVVEPDPARDVAAGVRACLAEREVSGDCAVVPGLDAVDWARIALVVECVPEALALKRDVFAAVEALARADAIIASNSSSFPVSAIGEGLVTQARMAGLHFFMPAHLVPLVEVISGAATAPETAARLCDVMTALAMRPVHVKKDIPGFLANRMQHALMREALSLADQGIASPEDIDAAVQFGFGMRFMGAGPLLQKDLSGIDIHHAAATTIYPDLCNDTAPCDFMRERLEAGDFGVKTGRGFYAWTADTIAARKARYGASLREALRVLRG